MNVWTPLNVNIQVKSLQHQTIHTQKHWFLKNIQITKSLHCKNFTCLRWLSPKAPIFGNLFYPEHSYRTRPNISLVLCSAKPHLSEVSLILMLATLLPTSLCTGEARFGLWMKSEVQAFSHQSRSQSNRNPEDGYRLVPGYS